MEVKEPKPYPLYAILIPAINLTILVTIYYYGLIPDYVNCCILSIPIGLSVGCFLHPRTIKNYYNGNYNSCLDALALMPATTISLILNVVYALPPIIVILTYISLYTLSNAALTRIHRFLTKKQTKTATVRCSNTI